MSPFLCAAYAPGAAYVAGCRGPPATLLHCLLALSSPLTVELVMPMHSFCKFLSPFWMVDNETTLTFTDEVGNGVTSLWHTVRLVLLSSPISSPFIHFRTPSHVPRLPTPFSPHFFLALPHTSRPGLSTEPFYPSSCPPTHFLSSNSLDDIFRPPSLSLTPPPPFTLILSHYDYKFTSLLPLSLTLSHLPPFPTPPASHSFTVFGYCP